MGERAQFTTPRAVRRLVTGAIALLVLALVVEEALSAPSLATGGVEQVCGLCHVDWRRRAMELGIIAGLVLAANWLLSPGVAYPDEEGHDE